MTVATTVPYDTMSTISTRSEPLFSKCCCCIPLRIGCFILGYLNLVINTFHTLLLLILTTLLGIDTHGFDHFDERAHPLETSNQITEVELAEKPILNQLGILLLVVLCANVAWLMVNVACLVGLHKKRPGPIRLYVGFATGRLLLSLASFVYLIMTAKATHTMISHSADLGLAAYFILVYYIYAVQLEREVAEESQERPEITSDIAFIYPTKKDKQNLVFA